MEPQEIDLRLSLSLNGRFGLDPLLQPKKLVRSSSIPGFLVPLRKEEVKEEGRVHVSQMVRTYSLPTMEREVEEECRKRKEMQSLRRMDVKKRRMEKQRNPNVVNMRRAGTSFREKNVARKGEEERRELGGSGSSGVSSESDAHQDKGRSTCCETGVPGTLKSLSKDEDHRAATLEPQFKQAHNKDIKLAEEMLRNVLEQMPCVSTKVDGPNGKRVEGFLYRYRKGEEIRIVCICHGQFLSPAEFVEHAGGSGGDITHPLKQIVVCPSSW